MATQTNTPLLSSGSRKYGRYESFERIDHRSSGHASIGSKSIGKANIDCEFLFKKSQWGVLGDQRYPAGIVYLNLNFGPPQGCRVKCATVTITLDEEDDCLKTYLAGRFGQAPAPLHHSGCPVQMTEWFGPGRLAGQSKTANVHLTTKLTPEINVLGNGGGGLGFESMKDFTHSARWSFNGQLLRGPGKQNWTYKSIRWDLNENELESQSFHSSKVLTAFTFEHSGQPFLLKVDINGKLEKWNDRIKSKLKFGAAADKDGKVVTLVDFYDYKRFQKSLDLVAKGLPRAMEMVNLQEIPVEVPDSMPGTFFQSAQTCSQDQGRPQGLEATDSTAFQTLPQPGRPAFLMADGPSSGLLSQQAGRPAISEFANDAQDLMRAHRELENPDLYIDLPEDLTRSSATSTAVRSEVTAPGTETAEATRPHRPGKEQQLAAKRGGSPVDEEAMARVLELPLIIMFLRLLASLMNLVGNREHLEDAPKRKTDNVAEE